MEVPVNWLAVIVAAVSNMAIGFAWYSDSLFGKQWRGLMGISGGGKPTQDQMMKTIGLGLLNAFLIAFVLSYSTVFARSYLGTQGVILGLMTGFWNWLGYMFPLLLGSYMYERKPLKLVWINSGFWLFSMLVMGVIIALWK